MAVFAGVNGAAQAKSGVSDSWFWLAIAAFLVVVTVWTMLVPPTIELSQTGIRLKAAWRRSHWSWGEIGEFRIVRWGFMVGVGYSYTDVDKARSARAQMLLNQWGSQGVLAGFGPDTVELVGALNRSRAKWLGGRAQIFAQPLKPSPVARASGLFAGLVAGRISRRTYWICWGVALAVALGVSLIPGGWIFGPTIPLVVWTPICWGRMRDIGRSPFWLLLPGPLVGVATSLAIRLGMPPLWAFGVVGLLFLVLTIALGVIPTKPVLRRTPTETATEAGSIFS